MAPLSVTDALNALQTQKDVADASSTAKATTAAALTSAQAADAQAATVLTQAGADLNTKREQFKAILDSFYTVGGTIAPVVAPPVTPVA